MSRNVTPKSLVRAFIVLTSLWLLLLQAAESKANDAYYSTMRYWWPAYGEQATEFAPADWYGKSPLLPTFRALTATDIQNFFAAGPIFSSGSSQEAIRPLVCLGCTIADGENAIDGDVNTASRITIGLGVAARIGQRIIFPGTYESGDSVVLDFEVPSQVYSASLLGGIRVEAYNGNTFVTGVDLDDVLRLQILGAGIGTTGKRRAIIPVNGTFDRVEVTVGALLSTLGSLYIYEATAIAPVMVTPTAIPLISPAGSTATFTASHRLPGATFRWYDAPVGGNLLGSGNTFTTPVLTRGVHNYYVEATTPDNKTSFIRTFRSVDVGGGPGLLWTYGDTQESPRIAGVCALCNVTDPLNAIDGDTTTSSLLSAPLGLLSTVGQYIGFPGVYQSGDSIVLDLELPGQILSLDLLPNITIQPYNNGAASGAPIALDNGPIRLQTLGAGIGGTSKFRVTVPSAVTFDGVQVNLTAAVAALSALRIYEAAAMIPLSVTPSPATIPYNTTATLNASIRSTGATFNWYTSPTGGTSVGTGTPFTTPALTRSTVYYVEAATPDGMRSYQRTAVNVNLGGAGPLWSHGDRQESPIIDGICVGCTVNNPLAAIDEDTTTASTISIPLGLLSTAGQRIRFPGTYQALDSIVLDLGIPAGQLLSGQLLSGITVETFNGTTSNNDAITLDQALLAGQVMGIGVGTSGKFRLTIPASATFDAVQISLSTAVGGFSNLDIYEATAIVPITVVPLSQTIPYGTTATINASNRLSNATFNWYTSPTGGSTVGTGDSFTTPALTRSGVYYVEAATPDGKTSYIRTAATVNVGGGPGPLWTYGDRQETLQAGGICVGCSVQDSLLAVDGDVNTSSLLSMPIAALGSIGQLIHFPGVYQAGDSVAIDLEVPDQLLSAQALAGITVQSYNGNTPNNDAITLDNGIVRLQPIGTGMGSTGKFRLILPVNNTFDGISISSSAALSALGNLRLYEAVAFMPVTVTPPSQTIPLGTTATMDAAVRAPNATFRWYEAPTGGTAVATTANFTTPALNRSKTYFVEASTPDGKTSFQRTSANVTVAGGPGPLWTFGDQQQSPIIGGICVGCAVQNPSLAADGDSTTASQLLMTLGALGSVGQIIQFPGTYQAGDSISFTLGVPSQAISGQLLSGVRVQTYNGTTANNDPVMLNNDLVNLQLLGFDPTGSVGKFRVTIPVNSDFDRAQVDLTGIVSGLSTLDIYEAAAFIPVTVTPENPNVPYGGQATLDASIRLPNATFSWYDSPTGGTPLATGSEFTTPPLLANTTFYVEAATPDGLTSYIRTAVDVGVTIGPGSPNLSCGAANAQTNATFGLLCLGCAVNSPALAADNDAETASRLHVPVGLLNAGVYQRLTFPAESAPGDSLRVVVGATTGLINLGLLNNVTIRPRNNGVENTADVRALNNGLLDLQLLNGGQRVAITFVPGTTFDEVEIRLAGVATALTETNVYYAQQVTGMPGVAADTVTVCSGQTATLNATTPAGSTFRWYDAPQGGNLLLTGATYTTGAVTADSVYYLEAVSAGSGCASEVRRPVFVKVGQPEVSVTASSVTIPQGGTATFNVNTPNPAYTYNWYTVPSGGTPVFTGPSYTTGALNMTTTFYVEAMSSGCPSAQRIPVIANVVITDPDVPCDIAGQQVSNVSGLCVGCYVDNQNSAVDASTTSFSTIHVVLGLLNSYAQQTLIFPTASDLGDSVRMLLSFPASLVDAGLLGGVQIATYNGTTYNNDRTTLNTAALNLQLLPGNQQAMLTFAPAAVFDRVELRLNSGLATALSAVNVHYAQRFVPVPVLQEDTVSICAGGTATFDVVPRANTIFRWYSTPTGGTPIATGTSFTSGALPTDTAFYVEAVKTSQNCANPVRTKATVLIGAAPVAPTVENATVTTCSSTSATLRATAPAGATFRWYAQPTGGTALFTGNPFITAALDSSVVYYVEAVSTGGCVSTTRTAVQVNISQRPATPGITPPSAAICAGGTATVTASSATPNVTFNWYLTAALDSVIHTGATFTTPALNTTTTYFVVAANGQCVSATPATVIIVVNQVPVQPTVSIDPSSGIVEYGQSAVLTASSTTPGATYRWFLDSVSTSPIATGATYTTPALAANTTYYVEAAGTAGCASARTAVTVAVNRNFNPGCDFANQQVSAINGICALCSVNTPDNSVDNDTTNFANLQMPIGLLGANITHTMNFGGLAAAGDTVKVRFSFPAGLLDLSVLSAIQITSYNGATSNGDTRTLDNAGVRLVLLGSSDQRVALFAPGGAYDRIEVRLISGVASALVNVNVHYANRILSAPTITTDNTTICSGGRVTLTATASDSATVRWYTTPTGGTPVFTGKEFLTPVLTANTVYYAESYRASTDCSNPIRTPVTIQVLPVPVAPAIIKGDTAICSGNSAVLIARPVNPAHTIRWYGAATGGTALSLDSVFTTAALTATTTFYAEAFNGTCGSATRVPVTVTVGTAPANPVLESNNVSVCTNTPATLRVTSSTTGLTINWYTVISGGTPVATGATFTTPALTGTTIYYVEATGVGGCTNPSGRIQATVTVNSTPAVPVLVDSVVRVCNNATASFSVVNPITGIVYNWYTAATGGTLVGTGTTFTTPALLDSATYFVEAVGTGNCISNGRAIARASVDSVITTPVVQSPDVTVCRGSQATLRVQNPLPGLTYHWYDALSAGNRVFTGPVFVTGAMAINTSYYVEAAGSGGCVSTARAQVDITVADAPAAPVVTGNNTVCLGDTVRLAIQNPQPGITYTWYSTATGGTALTQGTTFTPAMAVGVTTYYAQASNTTCSSPTRTSVTVTMNAVPVTPTVDATSKSVCAGTTADLHVTNPLPGITYRWYNVPTGGTVLSSSPDFVTPVINTTTTFYVEAVNSSNCASDARTSVTVTTTTTLATPVADTSMIVCRGSTATLRVTAPVTGVTYNWYSTPGGTVIHTGTSYTTGAVTANATYYIQATNSGGCTSANYAEVDVIVTDAPPIPVTSGNTTVCAGSTATLSIQNPQPGLTYTWYDAQTGGNIVAQGITYSPVITTGSRTFYVQSSVATCVSTGRASVTVTVSPVLPAPTVDATAKSVCAGTTADLHVLNPQTGVTYRWYNAATGGTLLSSSPDYITPAITATRDFYVEAVNTANCASTTRTRVTVNVSSSPQAPSVAPTVTVCRGNRATVSVLNPSTGLQYTWYDAPTGGTLLFTGTTYNSDPLTVSDTVYVQSGLANGNCTSTSRSRVILTVTDAPAVPALVSGGSITVCTGTAATFNVQNPLPGVTYNWYSASTGGTLLEANSTSFTTGPLTATFNVYVEAVVGSGCMSASRATGTATVGNQPVAPNVTADANMVCPDSTATIRATSTQSGTTFNWYTSATGGNAIFTGPVYTTPALTEAGTYYVSASFSGGCTSPTRTAVTINLYEPLPAPTVSVASKTATSVTFQWNAIAGAIGYRVSTDNGVTFTQPSSGLTGTTHTVNNLQPNQTVTLQVMAIGASECANSGWFLGGGGTDNPAGNTVFVPNAFTPNGDGTNDVLYVYGTTISAMQFRVYNQWGQMIFESRDKGRGWDGTVSGRKQPVGVYNYVLEASLQDGTRIRKRGTITIIR